MVSITKLASTEPCTLELSGMECGIDDMAGIEGKEPPMLFMQLAMLVGPVNLRRLVKWRIRVS